MADRVFVSHASELARYPASKSYVAAAKEAVLAADRLPVEMAEWTATDQAARDECRRRLESCQVYVGIFGFKYGTVLDGSSYTEFEFDEAGRLGLPRLVFLLAENPLVPIEPRQAAFREKARSGRVSRTVNSPDELAGKVLQALTDLEADLAPGQPMWLVPEPGGTVTAEDRPGLVRELTGLVLAEGASTVGVTAVYGTGGFGKTTLTQVVCRGDEVKRRFPGGALWVAVGQDVGGPALAEKINELTALLGAKKPLTDPEQAGLYLGGLLDARPPMLLVIDDVWRPEQLRPFLHGGAGCRRVVTTRDRRVLPTGVVPLRVDRMAPDEAGAILADALSGVDAATADRLVRLTGRWPLLISLVNGYLLEEVGFGGDPEQVAAALADRLAADGPASPTLASDAGREHAVAATVEASFGTLTSADRDRVRELGVFAEDEDVPVAMVELLWGSTLDADGTARLVRTLAARSVIDRYRADVQTIRLHDVIRRYLQDTLGPDRLAAAHGAFLDAAARLCDGWWSLPTDADYLWRHLIQHLVDAGRGPAAVALCTDLRWLGADLLRSGPAAIEAHLSHLGQAATASTAALARAIQQNAHLLTPLDPPHALTDTLISRLVGLEPILTGTEVDGLAHLVNDWWPPDLPEPALRRVLTGHTDSLEAVAIAPDGSWLASAGRDGTVRLWDTTTWAVRRILTGHAGSVNALAVSPDGSWLATGGDDGTVRIWDVIAGERHTITSRGRVTGVAIAPDGSWLASIGGDGRVLVWESATGVHRRTLAGHARRAPGLAIAPDSSWLVVTGKAGAVVWDLATGAVRHLPISWLVIAIALAADGRTLAVACVDNSVRVVDAVTGAVLRTLPGSGEYVHGLAFAPDGSWLATAGDNGSARIWDLDTGTVRNTLGGHTEPVRAVAVAPDGTWLASVGDRRIRTWSAPIHVTEQGRSARTSPVAGVAFAPDGSWLATAGPPGVRRWSMTSGAPIDDLTGPEEWLTAIAAAPDGTWLVGADRDGATYLLALRGSAVRGRRLVEPVPVSAVAVAPDGTWFATAGYDGTVRTWDPNPSVPRLVVTGHAGRVSGVMVAPDGSFLATAGIDGIARTWDAATGAPRHTLAGHSGPLEGLAIAPDSGWLATAGEDGTVRSWDARTGSPRRTFVGHTGPVFSVTAGGAWLATGGADGSVRVWDEATGEPVAAIRVDGPVDCVAWGPDGTRLAAGGPRGLYLFRVGG